MQFSAFARLGGGFRFSSQPPLAQQFYEQLRDSDGGVYQADSFTGPVAARRFALAMMAARAAYTLERAANQSDPLKLWDMLTTFESMYGLSPSPTDTLQSRRNAVALAMVLSRGPRRGNVEDQLRTALGSDFRAWITTPAPTSADQTTFAALQGHGFPSSPETIGRFDDPPNWKAILLLDPVAFCGVPVTVHWQAVSGATDTIAVGDQFVVAPRLKGIQELVTVTARTNTTLTATFANAHESSTMALRMPWPSWWSIQKHSLVVVKNGRATDPVLRQRVLQLLRILLGTTSSWDIVEENTTPGTTGPFIPGQGKPGITPILAYSF